MPLEREFDFDSPRQVNLLPTNNSECYYKLLRLQDALRISWQADTVAEWERDKWTPCLPSFGQCTVTALVVQDVFGGKIVKDAVNDHFWNLLDDGTEVDLSREQLPEGLVLKITDERAREYMLSSEKAIVAKTGERYQLLRERVRKILGE
ncbi:MAG TPA: hypothetical protein VMR19_00300 [Candidatus Saccharimonadales bacterium]|jgi:hypothetical protein|nr:hypothetical protein [Candidatus Saccharimonadales bacterium]